MKRTLAVLVLLVALVSCNRSSDSEPAAESVDVMGTYTAQVPASDFREHDFFPAKELEGEWTLEVKDDGTYVVLAENFRVTERWSISGDTFAITATPAAVGAYNCYDENGDRLTGNGEAAAEYRVENTDEGLTFTAVFEPCIIRPEILERTWEPAA